MKRALRSLIIVGAAVGIGMSLRFLLPHLAAGKGSNGVHTVRTRLQQFGKDVQGRLEPYIAAAGVEYPPREVLFLVCKQERRLELYAAGKESPLRFIREYPVLAASGEPGPKLREGDRQVPEGFYPIELLNPNSLYHVSLRVGYPNKFDRKQADSEGRTNLGSDIMIHGGAASIGCVAMGDPVAEELFTLAALTGLKKVRVIISPIDFRDETQARIDLPASAPSWTTELHDAIRAEVLALKK